MSFPRQRSAIAEKWESISLKILDLHYLWIPVYTGMTILKLYSSTLKTYKSFSFSSISFCNSLQFFTLIQIILSENIPISLSSTLKGFNLIFFNFFLTSSRIFSSRFPKNFKVRCRFSFSVFSL